MSSFLPHVFLLLSTLFLGTLISISSNNWLLMWAGLELNLMSFIPIMKTMSFHKSAESVMKYFMTQACASAVIITMMLTHTLPMETVLTETLIIGAMILSLLAKLGMTPCHWWFPTIMMNLNWPIGLVLLTWQKIAPILIILSLSDMANQIMMALIITTSALVGGFGGHNQTNIKALLAFSSIGHMSWIMAANILSWVVSIYYLMTYMLMATAIMLFMMINNVSPSFKKLLSWKAWNPYKAIGLCILLMSMAGLPPFLGFIPKAMTFYLLLNKQLFSILMALYIGTILNLSYYMNLIFHITITPIKSKKSLYYTSPWNVGLLMTATAPILLFPLML